MRKRPAPHAHPKQNEIYVNRKSPFPVAMKRAETLLFLTGYEEVIIHGLGASIPKATQLALALQAKDPSITLVTTTSTVPLIDDLSDTVRHSTPSLHSLHTFQNGLTTSTIRHNSAIHIRVIQTNK